MDAGAGFGDGFPPGVHGVGGAVVAVLEAEVVVVVIAVVVVVVGGGVGGGGGGGWGAGGDVTEVVHVFLGGLFSLNGGVSKEVKSQIESVDKKLNGKSAGNKVLKPINQPRLTQSRWLATTGLEHRI